MPLSRLSGVPAVSTAYSSDGRSLVTTFSKAALAGLSAGDNVPFTVSGTFNRDGAQAPMSLSTLVKVVR